MRSLNRTGERHSRTASGKKKVGDGCSRRDSAYCQQFQASETYDTYEEMKGCAVRGLGEVLVMEAYARVTDWAFFLLGLGFYD